MPAAYYTDAQQAGMFYARKRRRSNWTPTTWNVYLKSTGEFQISGEGNNVNNATYGSTSLALPEYNAETHKPFFVDGDWELHSL